MFGGSAGVLALLYSQAWRHMEETVRVNVGQLALAASNLVEVEKHEKLVSPDQQGGDLYTTLQRPLVEFHLQAPEIHYLYTARESEQRQEWFVLDTSNDPRVREMLEARGHEVEPSALMEPYELPDFEENEDAALAMRANEVFVFDFIYEDAFGSFISAQAPLFLPSGEYVGYLGVDYDVQAFAERMRDLRLSGWWALGVAALVSAGLALLAYFARKQGEENHLRLVHAEQTMRSAKEKAEAAVAAKDEMMAVVSHDLRNPISAIIGLTELTLSDLPQHQYPEARENLEEIGKSAQGMLDLVNGLLAKARLDYFEKNLDAEVFDLGQLATEVIRINRLPAERKNIELRPNLETPLDCHGDRRLLRLAFDNLIGNAIKYSPPGKPVFVELARSESSQSVRFSVRDEGPGISPNDQARLFQKFGSLDSVPTGSEQSTGLGLSIVRKVADLHKGTVGCKSQPGHGSTFWIELPLETP